MPPVQCLPWFLHFPEGALGLPLGSILHPFWEPFGGTLGTQSRPRNEKEAFIKNIRKHASNKAPKSLKNELQNAEWAPSERQVSAKEDPSETPAPNSYFSTENHEMYS